MKGPSREILDTFAEFLILKVQAGEIAVVFLGRLVVGAGGVELVVEVADELGFAIDHDPHGPSLLAPVPGQAFVFGVEAALVALSAISGVLGLRGGAKVGPPVVQAVMVDMVNKHAGGHGENLAVHLDDDSLLAELLAGIAHGVKRAPGADDMPFILAEPVEIGRIDQGILVTR